MFSFLTPARTPRQIVDAIAAVPVSEREAKAQQELAGISRHDERHAKVVALVKPYLPATVSGRAIAALISDPIELVAPTLTRWHAAASDARDVVGLELINEAFASLVPAGARQNEFEAIGAQRDGKQADGLRMAGKGLAPSTASTTTATAAVEAVLAGPESLIDETLLAMRANALATRDAPALALVGRALVAHRAKVTARIAQQLKRVRLVRAQAAAVTAAREAALKARMRRSERYEGMRG